MQQWENVRAEENNYSPPCLKHAKLIIELSKSANMTERSIYTIYYAVEDHAQPIKQIICMLVCVITQLLMI